MHKACEFRVQIRLKTRVKLKKIENWMVNLELIRINPKPKTKMEKALNGQFRINSHKSKTKD